MLKKEYGEENVLSQYKDERYIRIDGYKYECDFYIKSLDLFIEYQGFFTHQGHPFDSNNIKDIEILNTLKEKAKTSIFYKNIIYTWTVSDVNKRLIAKQNNLNFLELWPNDWLNKNPKIEIKNIKNKIESFL